ncbi:hypothetical protein AWJ20_3671 [Sugiyamaella lignohabitans]|uniref:GATA-type domain-containing protein n=1 Tax=Sugiyamaella lignohabitans TaxID=796027 RepID=A0A161HIA3_9ASCO|nr:uncharacterized protein AWJ20_3671 [Sugiyamaella lignohabitans]ANB16020.1 hypothetical protein AWJ20_3671 [Sugiyamaella lignohabitans]
MYTFDKTHSIMCLARLPNVVSVPVAYGDDNSPLGVIDLGTCLQAVNECSPELIAGTSCKDYAVYSVDFTEPDQPLVGHGMLSWVTLQRLSQNSAPVWLAGKVTNNILPLYAAKETLEVHLRLFPLQDTNQDDYLASIRVYESLAKNLPSDFNHPAWARFVSSNAGILNLDENRNAQPTSNQMQNLNRSKSQILTQTQGETQNQHSRQIHVQNSNQSQPQSLQHQANQHNQNQNNHSMAKRSYSLREVNANTDKLHEAARRNSTSSRPASVTPSSPILQAPKRYKSLANDSAPHPYYPASSPPPTTSNTYGSHNQHRHIRASSPIRTSDNHSNSNSNVISTQKGLIRLSSIDLSSAFNDSIKSTNTSNSTAPPAPATSSSSSSTTRARGRRRRAKDDDGSGVDVVVQCDNCGTTKTPTWRRVKTGDKDRNLCNPCGLWYQTKKTMRPESLWHNAAKNSKKKAGANNGDNANNDSSNGNGNTVTSSLSATARGPVGPSTAPNSSSANAVTPVPNTKPSSSSSIPATSLTNNASRLDPSSTSPADGASISRSSTPSSATPNVETTGGDTIDYTGNGPSPDPVSKPAKELTTNLSQPLHLPSQNTASMLPPLKAANSEAVDDESDKENRRPTSDQSTNPHGHEPDTADIDSLFETPKKNRIRSDIPMGSITPTSKWIAKLIQPRSDDDDVFKAFLDSPSKRALGGVSSSNGNRQDQLSSVVSDMTFDGSMDNSSIPSEPLMMPSSPPTSFFYLYDETTSHWPTKQWGHDTGTAHVTPSEFDEDDAGAPTVKSLQ